MKYNSIRIENEETLYKLINDIKNKQQFCDKFDFADYEFKYIMLKELKINCETFDKKYYYHNKKKKLHISESEWGSFLISTYGMVIYNEKFNTDVEKIIFAFESQGEVLEILLDKVGQLLKKKDIYDIDSYNYNYLMKLSTGLTNNIVLFLELFAKAYISVNNEKYPKVHDLRKLLYKMRDVIYKKEHNDTYFNAEIVHQFSEIIKIVNSSDEKFIEQYIKYNESIQPSFSGYDLHDLRNFVSLCIDSISCLFYSCEDLYFRKGLYKRLLNKVTTDEEKQKIRDYYSFLIEKKELL